jgi:hypothetical protein
MKKEKTDINITRISETWDFMKARKKTQKETICSRKKQGTIKIG